MSQSNGDFQARLEAARLRLHQYEEFIEVLPDGLVEADVRNFRVTLMNATARRMFGYTPDEVADGILATALIREDYLPIVLKLHVERVGKSAELGVPYERTGKQEIFEWVGQRRNGSTFLAEVEGSYVVDQGVVVRGRWLFRDITARRNEEEERQRLVEDLQEAVASVRTLSGMLPICAVCKSVRDDRGYWTEIESYMRKNTGIDFSHGLCPTCRAEIEDAR